MRSERAEQARHLLKPTLSSMKCPVTKGIAIINNELGQAWRSVVLLAHVEDIFGKLLPGSYLEVPSTSIFVYWLLRIEILML